MCGLIARALLVQVMVCRLLDRPSSGETSNRYINKNAFQNAVYNRPAIYAKHLYDKLESNAHETHTNADDWTPTSQPLMASIWTSVMSLHCWYYFLNIIEIVNDLTLPSICIPMLSWLRTLLTFDLLTGQKTIGWRGCGWWTETHLWLQMFSGKTGQTGLTSWFTDNHSLCCYLGFRLETDLDL